jgi:hypothetical protein
MLKDKQDRLLEAALAAVRDETPDPVTESAAAERTLGLLRAGERDVEPERIRGCEDVRALLPALAAQRLAAGRALLVEDHLRECPTCRAAFDGSATSRHVASPWTRTAETRPAFVWGRQWLAVAAALVLTVGLGFSAYRAWFGVPAGPSASVESIGGELYALEASGAPRVLRPGATLGEQEAVRTGSGGHAVLALADGSRVEMDGRAEVSVSRRGRDTTLQLDRGNVIVRAAKRSSGHLYVATADCRVAVTGTIFSVSHGLVGSRVAVIEGEVHVRHAGREDVLHPGQQVATAATMRPVPLREEIAWSREREQHLALLGELQALEQRFASLPSPALRYEGRLLRLAPEDTTLYAALPNYGETLGEGYALFKERLVESPVLQRWWQKDGPGREAQRVDELVAKLQTLAEYLGDEVVIAGHVAGDNGPAGALVLAEVRKPGLQQMLETELAQLGQASGGKAIPLRIVDEAGLAAAAEGPLVLVTDELVAAGTARSLRALLVRRGQTQGGFGETAFGERLRAAYASGAGLLVALDLERLDGPAHAAAHGPAGMPPLRTLIIERKALDGRIQNAARLSFGGQRTGLASWLASPAPMGALEFVSPQATGVAAFVLKDPVALLDDILAGRVPDPHKGDIDPLAEIESQIGLNLRDDVMAALGGEVAFALDGPLLPQPSWKLIVEVKDADRLLSSVTALIDVVNREASAKGEPAVRLDHERLGEGVSHVIRPIAAKMPFEIHFTFAGGYLIAAPSRALLTRALETQQSGITLARSSELAALLPAGTEANCSGLLYQNLGPALGPLAQTLGQSGALSADGQQTVSALAASARPSALVIFGEDDAIRLAAVGELPGLDASTLALPALLKKTFGGTRAPAHP